MFNVNYLGGNMPTFALNFSRPGSEVIAQYFMFMSLGREGYTAMMQTLQHVAMLHRQTAWPTWARTGSSPTAPSCRCSRSPLNPDVKNYTVFDVSDRLRERGWLVPAYTFPENRQDLSVLRVVVRAGMHKEMADELLEALAEKTKRLESLSAPLPPGVASTTAAFAH